MTGRTIVITSGKGGVGKTTATANLGTALAMRGHKVVVIDTDIGLRNLDVIMGLENRIVYDLVNVIEGKCKMHQAMIRDKHQLELFLIPAAQTRDKDSIEPEQLRELCEKLENEFDYVLMDDQTYDQIQITPTTLGDATNYMVEQGTTLILMYGDEVIGVELPASVELVIAQTEPGIQGDRVSGARKPATLETGLVVQVPLFIENDERVKVDTRSGEYLSRA